jgi:hypothetical protein
MFFFDFNIPIGHTFASLQKEMAREFRKNDFAQILISKARRLYTILQILSITLFEKTPISEALSIIRTKELEHVPCNQFTLFD